jgi:hypothetical protein
LADFSSAVDLSVFPADQKFSPATSDSNLLMGLKGKPYRMERECYSIAAVAHHLLFGEPLEIDDGVRITLKSPLKKYWNTVWTQVFDSLLNGSMDGLADILRKEIVKESAHETTKGLKMLLKSIDCSFILE